MMRTTRSGDFGGGSWSWNWNLLGYFGKNREHGDTVSSVNGRCPRHVVSCLSLMHTLFGGKDSWGHRVAG